jgi:hypothetical protein
MNVLIPRIFITAVKAEFVMKIYNPNVLVPSALDGGISRNQFSLHELNSESLIWLAPGL